MNTWKLSIKPDSDKGYNPFKVCKENHLLGLGWSGAYENKQPNNIEEAKNLVREKYNKWPYPIKYLMEDMKPDDHIWIRQKGAYYLCKAEEKLLYGNEIDENFLRHDLGHARKAKKWVKVPEVYVSGSIQRGVIAQRMIQKINVTNEEYKFHNILFEKLSDNSKWKPYIEEIKLAESITKISKSHLFALMSPDDMEDVVSAFLQSQGWIIIKSTCFRSKPDFEFSMLNKKNMTGSVQVKSGKYPDPLHPKHYESHSSESHVIYLFSTNPNPYPGDNIEGVIPIYHNELIDWIVSNTWALTYPLKIRLWVFIQEFDN